VEVSRKHGPFDTRWPRARKDTWSSVPTVSLDAAEVAEALDWHAFSARYFPERSRHDSEARSAYVAYRQGREWRQRPTRLRLVPTEPALAAVELESDEAGRERLLAAVAALDPREAQGRVPTDQRYPRRDDG
jgi:hypothetical protein